MLFRHWCTSAVAAFAAAASFTPGNVVLSRLGDGIDALGTATAEVFLDEYDADGVVQSIPLPSGALTLPPMNPLLCQSPYQLGAPATPGLLTRSRDGRFITLVGLAQPAGTAWGSLQSSWTIGRVAYNGSVDTTTSLVDSNGGECRRGALAYANEGLCSWLAARRIFPASHVYGPATSSQVITG
jgi:hypothetical protein